MILKKKKKTVDYSHKTDLLSQKSYRRQLHPGLVSSITHQQYTTLSLVSIPYSDVSRLPLEQQYIIVCTGIWPERLKETLSPKYIMAL